MTQGSPSLRWVKVGVRAGYSGIITQLLKHPSSRSVGPFRSSGFMTSPHCPKSLDTISLRSHYPQWNCQENHVAWAHITHASWHSLSDTLTCVHRHTFLLSLLQSCFCWDIFIYFLKSSFLLPLLQMLKGPELVHLDHKSSQRLKAYFWILPYSPSFPDTEPIPAWKTRGKNEYFKMLFHHTDLAVL